ncbi:MAG TPA: saccharopine dehydrogenase [Candidatus Atribacteria bacterium]|nr:saccharopine dehydrogenase [Candidatus Atribacteria bacterium]
MKMLVLGAGPMGYAIVKDLVKDESISEVTAIDINVQRLRRLEESVKSEKLSTIKMDVMDKTSLLKLMKKHDCILGALPHRFVVHTNKVAIEAGVSLVDLAFEKEQLDLDEEARKNDVTIIPGCGVAPGLSNMLVAYGASKMEKVNKAYIRVGGIPLNPKPPLDYKIVFSVESLIGEYIRPAKIVKDGKIIHVPALSGIEVFTDPELGELECFYTDGLSTLIYTMKHIPNMAEKTIRWPGHAEKIKVLRELGFFDTKPIKIKDITITPFHLSAKLLNEKLSMKEDDKDLTILIVDVIGLKGNTQIHCNYRMIDYYDSEEKITSMGRTSGFPCAIMARMIVKGEVKGPGVIPPEIALTPSKFEEFTRELAKRNIVVSETITTIKTLG